MGVSTQQLRKAQAAFDRAYQAMQSASERRNELVRSARRDGWTQKQIREATGLTSGRISQIARGRER